MALHHRIMHHVHKHKDRVVAHVKKHHVKYLFGAGVISGMAVFKLIGIIAIFFGVTYMGGGTLGGDYYDAERELQQAAKEISLIANTLTGAEAITGCSTGSLTGTDSTGVTVNCP